MAARKYICPSCKQKTGVPIFYGEPGAEACELLWRGEIVLGGCCWPVGGPERECTACGHQWRIKRRKVDD
jgi:hypothetical protein